MVVQPGESNSVDQRILEYTLWNKSDTRHSIATATRGEAAQRLHASRALAHSFCVGVWMIDRLLLSILATPFL